MTQIEITAIRRDGGTQLRAGSHEDTIQAYADAMRDGVVFPPIVVFVDAGMYWLADGFQRIEAASRIGLTHIAAEILGEYEGESGRRAAVLYACGANDAHGLRRTNEDKRRAVKRLLEDEEWVGRSDRWIAEVCKVSPDTVGRWRHQLSESDSKPPCETSDGEANGAAVKTGAGERETAEKPRKYVRNGKVSTMKTGGIGTRSENALPHRGQVRMELYLSSGNRSTGGIQLARSREAAQQLFARLLDRVIKNNYGVIELTYSVNVE